MKPKPKRPQPLATNDFDAGNPTIAVALGAVLLFETAGASVVSNPSGSQYVAGGASGAVVPLPTPGYHFATGAQTFIGPYIGLQFGP